MNPRIPILGVSNVEPLYLMLNSITMGLLNQNKKDKDAKKGTAPKNAGQGSKFIASKSTKAAGGPKKPMTGGAQRGS